MAIAARLRLTTHVEGARNRVASPVVPGAVFLFALVMAGSVELSAQQPTIESRNDSVMIRLIDVDLRSAVQALGSYLDRPVTFAGLPAVRVTLETPTPIARAQVAGMLRAMVEGQNLELFADTIAGLYRVRPRERPTPEPREAMRPVTRPGEQQPLQLWTIRLRHARAADVAATVNALYGRATAIGEIGARPTSLGDELRDARVPPQAPHQAPLPGMPPSELAPRGATFVGEVVIVPDAGSNSLLIRATREDQELILAAVQEIDVRPLQVLIEVLIVEARKDRSFSFGVEATLPPTAVRRTSNTTVSAGTVGLGLGDFALRVMNIGGYDIDATLVAAAARGDVSIVSRPIVLAANNEFAEILVGSQRPFVQVSRSLPTDTPQRDQVIQYKDVGTQLRVRPTISADGYVMLLVTQEVNAATTEVQFDAPVISTRLVTTQLLIRDGQTVVLGGLTDTQRDRNQAGVPVLSSIPLLGGLFGRASRRTTETELFLFLTPHVIRTDEDADAATQPLRERSRQVTPDP